MPAERLLHRCSHNRGLHRSAFQRAQAFLGGLLLLVATGCDSYGLPAYQIFVTTPPEGQSGAGILDIDPKLGRAGETIEITVVGFKTSFSEQTTVAFPSEPELTVQSVTVDSFERLRCVVAIGVRAEPGSRVLEVTSPADGALLYESGFSVVQ